MIDTSPLHQKYFTQEDPITWKEAIIMSLWDTLWMGLKIGVGISVFYILFESHLKVLAENVCPLLK